MSRLDRKLELKDGEIFKFSTPGDRVYARFVNRRTVTTKKQEAAAVLDAYIIESRVVDLRGSEEAGPVGAHTIFESTHVTQLLDREQLQAGEHFVLQFCAVDPKKGFKKFALEKTAAPTDEDSDWPTESDGGPEDFEAELT